MEAQLYSYSPKENTRKNEETKITTDQQQLIEWAARLEVECLTLIDLNRKQENKPSAKDTPEIPALSAQVKGLQTSVANVSDQLKSVAQLVRISDKLTSSVYNKINGLEKRISVLENQLSNSRALVADTEGTTFSWEQLTQICENAILSSTKDIKDFLLMLVPRVIEVEKANRTVASSQEEIHRLLKSLSMPLTENYPDETHNRNNNTANAVGRATTQYDDDQATNHIPTSGKVRRLL